MNKATVRGLSVALLLGLAAQPLLGSNLRWLNDSAVRFFTERDWEIVTEAGRKALNEGKDGETVSWENPETGHSGSLTPLKTVTTNGATCRQLKVVNSARGTMADSIYEFCQEPDGRWGTVGGGMVAPAPYGVAGGDQGRSIMFQREQDDYSHLTTRPSGEAASLGDKCEAMSREIDELRGKGKPQTRSTLMERYRAECQR